MNSWMVVFACGCVNFMVLGMARLAPILFVDCIERYQTQRDHASFPFVLCYLLRTLSGPLIGYIAKKIGLRATTLLGCVGSALGIGLCFFAEDITAITVFWGCIYGLGFGFGSSLLPAILSTHFKENLTTATGIAYVGSSIGATILPLIADVALKTYGLSGTFLILGGLTLNSAAMAILLKEKDSTKKAKSKLAKVKDVSKTNVTIIKLTEEKDFPKSNIFLNNEASKTTTLCSTTNGYTNKALCIEDEKSNGQSNSFQTYPIFKNKSKSEIEPDMPVLLQVHRLSSDFFGNSCESVAKSADTNKEKKTRLGAFHIFWDLTFLMIVLNQSLFTFEVTIFWTIIIDYVRDKAIDRSKEVYFLVCISLSDMIGRLGLGFVVDSGFMQLANYCVLCYLVMGVALCFTVWSNNFVLMILSVFLFSLMTGGAMIVLPGQVITFMKKDDLAMAMSSRMILFAPLSLTASPLIGFFRGTLNSYDGLLYMMSCLCVLSAVLVFIIPFISRRCDKKHLQDETPEGRRNTT
ncbi:uncharacterized protein CDAR_32111 [Caerostris darwini]|uniref:Uncharacterized protein n=1 Tax=Caerostris darwini TaxID=1538125 RepID=A0AAV4RQG4_9ARAC|nr:uncharacterized protein CDAR_32111 [Caerostris darwini]